MLFPYTCDGKTHMNEKVFGFTALCTTLPILSLKEIGIVYITIPKEGTLKDLIVVVVFFENDGNS